MQAIAESAKKEPATFSLTKQTIALITFAISVGFGLGQTIANTATPPPTAELAKQMATITSQISELKEEHLRRERKIDRVLLAILIYQTELDRYAQASCKPECPPRPVELDEISRQIRDIIRQ